MPVTRLGSALKLNAVEATGAAIAVAATFALCLGVLGPLNAHNRQNAAHRQTTARERQRLAAIVTEVRDATLVVTTMQAQIAASPLHLLTQDKLNQRLADLATLSSSCGLSVQDVKPGSSAQAPRFTVIPVRMIGHGSYRNCYVFVHLLHELLPDINVCSFKLSGSPEDPGAAGDFDFRLCWLAEPASPPPASHDVTVSLP